LAKFTPSGGAITGAPKTRRIDKCLDQYDGMPVKPQPIITEPLEIQGKQTRSEIRLVAVRKDEKTDVVGDKVETTVVELRPPADPSIAGRTFERGRSPAKQGEPSFFNGGNIIQGTADDTLKAEIVVPTHEITPARQFLPPGKTHLQAVILSKGYVMKISVHMSSIG
jgi:hypothetical protein